MDCVLCKLAARHIFGGFSLCKDHFQRVIEFRAEDGGEVLDIVETIEKEEEGRVHESTRDQSVETGTA